MGSKHQSQSYCILNLPDAPTSFIENYLSRSATTIAFTWVEGLSDGGASVLDYTISYDQSVDQFISLESGISSGEYTAIGLTSGLVYKFKV